MLRGETPTAAPPVPQSDQPLAAPFDLSPGVPNLPKIGYHISRGLTGSAPELAGGIAGGAGGTMMVGGPENPAAAVAAPVGAGIGAGAVNMARSIAPFYAEAMKKFPNDHDKAFDEALKQAGTSGAVTGVAFAFFGVKPFASAVKNILFQAFAAQPAISAGGQAIENVVAGRPAGEGVPQAAVEAVPGTLVPLLAERGARTISRLGPSRPATATETRTEPFGPEVPPSTPEGHPAAPESPAPPVGPSGPEAAPSPPAGTQRVFTPSGTGVDTRPEVVDASKLTTSHTGDMAVNPNYPAELQPRDRSRAASGEQVAAIASNLRPELLGDGAGATTGAPIVGPDGAVESGNARVLALRRAYDLNNVGSQRYRDWLKSQGFDTAGMKEPVLVRRRVSDLTPDQREQFTREANQRTTAAMSAAEQASADVKSMPDDLVAQYRGGDLTGGQNLPFVRGFIDRVVPSAERACVYTREGGLSQEGLRRLENALFAKAYDDSGLLASLREDQDANFKAIGGAMTDAAPDWARMRAEAARGEIPATLDITPDLRAAVRLVREARRKSVPVTDLLRQGDMISGGHSAETQGVLRLMFRDDKMTRPASRPRVEGALRFYAEQARKAQPGPGLFGTKAVDPTELLHFARQQAEGGLLDVLPAAAESRSIEDLNGELLPETANMEPGANYRGARQDTYNPDIPSAARSADVLRRENILHDLDEGSRHAALPGADQGQAHPRLLSQGDRGSQDQEVRGHRDDGARDRPPSR